MLIKYAPAANAFPPYKVNKTFVPVINTNHQKYTSPVSLCDISVNKCDKATYDTETHQN